MTKMRPAPAIAIAIVLLAYALPASAKTRYFADGGGDAGLPASASPAEIERRLRPALEERVKIRRGAAGGGYQLGDRPVTAYRPATRPPAISQKDLYLMMRAWGSMTPEFHALYAEAVEFPSGYDGYDSYLSPGGNFKIFYTTSGTDSISVVDTIGYGGGDFSALMQKLAPTQKSTSTNMWRARQSAPNGVPDYIDEAAFALDSAWSMLIDRFGFAKPIPSHEPTGPSTGPYNVLICNTLSEGEYGVTIPHSSTSAGPGFPSHLEINGDWSGRDWVGTGYDKRPYDALRVTCAHEFFHAIQYALVWTKGLDDITYGWLEGSAVLMEEIAFPDVNDYLQYIERYFTNPARVSLLSNNYDYIYMNGLVLKYLYEKGSLKGESIGMIKAVHDNARAQRMIPFHMNITQASSAHAARPWVEVLNGFHAESYFTGARARPQMFVTDAELMERWRVPTALATEEESVLVGAYAVGFLRYEPQADHPDTLVLSIKGDKERSVDGLIWGASALVTEEGDSVGIVPIPIDENGYGRFELAGWKGKSQCLLVLTNAGPPAARKVSVRIGAQTDTLPYAPLKILPNVVKLGSSKPIRIAGGDISEIKIVAQNGSVVDYWNGGGNVSRTFQKSDDGAAEWYPQRRGKRLVPGVYFISASSTNPDTNKKSTQRRKIMVLP